MIGGNIYIPKSPAHPYLDFVGCIDPFCRRISCCSAVLIDPKYVITAAHCIDCCDEFTVRFPGEEIHEIEDIRIIKNQDIAVCRLKKPSSISPISISQKSVKIDDFIIVAGWGGENLNSEDQKGSRLNWHFSEIESVSQNFEFAWARKNGTPQIQKGDSGGAIVTCVNGEMQLAGVIVRTNNLGAGLWNRESQLPYCGHELLISGEKLDFLKKIDAHRQEVFSVLDDVLSITEAMAVDEWILGKMRSNE